jgi:hypothetical protein
MRSMCKRNRRRSQRVRPAASRACPRQPTLSVDVVPIRTLTKAVTGGVAFAVGKSLDINPRIKVGKLPLKVRPR